MAQVGLNCHFYAKVANLTGDALPAFSDIATTGNERKLIGDVSLDLSGDSAEIPLRATRWRLRIPTLKDGTISVQVIYDTHSGDFTLFKNSFEAVSPLTIFVGDDPLGNGGTLTSGYVMDAIVSSLPIPQSREDVTVCEVEIVPTLSIYGTAGQFVPTWISGSVA
jgi:hypothetical protein